MRKILLAIVLLFSISGAQAECRFLGEPGECLAEAEHGNAIAQFVLGFMYENGEGFEQNHKEAAKWYRKAAEQGDADAQYHLGKLYADDSLGVEQDYVIAHMWFSIAGTKGDKAAFLQRDLIAKRMTPEQIQEAQKRTKAWMAEHSE